ncbi:mitochondrial mRNA pseudouridine synthase RPUSD3 [Petromyzon marinus]|uniref:Mitochondrial mRNA pseudouridine synthase RPUSD3 n=1 Tax=Petromyzon marinus TaxID=7757 RepID=A0AAJ7X995_PETMA|nr:mitochondrial mRNA pseudouridine synthase RPUSD3 [Petromyzon marinus]
MPSPVLGARCAARFAAALRLRAFMGTRAPLAARETPAVSWAPVKKAEPFWRPRVPGRESVLRAPGVSDPAKMNREQLLEALVAAVVYRKDPILAIGKPAGLGVHESQTVPEQLALEPLLPELARLLGVSPDLHLVKAPSRDVSGVVLLSVCHHTTKELEAAFSRLRRAREPASTYWAVTVGTPERGEGDIDVPLATRKIGDHLLVVPVPHPTKASLKRQEVKKALTRYRVLCSAADCALVELQPVTAFRDQLRVHLTIALCVAVGDHVYSGRVGRVLGVRVPVAPETALPRAQVLDEAVLCRMHVSQPQVHRLPLHLHLAAMHLPRYGPAQEGTWPTEGPWANWFGGDVIRAPAPPYFLRTMELLGLERGGASEEG